METIDLKDYIKTGEGNNGESFDSISDPEVMVKLYKKGYDTEAIITEHDVAEKVYQLGIKSPEPGDLITCDGRIGIRFRKVAGKRSYSRAFADEPERVPEYAREFARYCKMLHATEVPGDMFPDNKAIYLDLLDKVIDLPSDMKDWIRNFIVNEIPECTTALHGDMHFGNLLTTLPKGEPLSAPHDVYFIDLGYFAKGCPLMDLGMTYSICNVSDEEFLEHDMHFGRAIAKVAWDNFCDEYFFGPEKLAEKWFGKGATVQTVNEGMKPYVAVKLLLVDFNVGFMPPSYLDFIRSCMK